MPRTSLIRLPLDKRAEVMPALAVLGVPLCPCCRHCELDRDKTGKPWLVVQAARHANNQRRDQCRRCGNPCANVRCAELPPNPHGRGYGQRPVRSRSMLDRLLGR